MTDREIRRKDRILKRRYFNFGVWTCAAVLMIVAIFGTMFVILGVDARPIAAILPLLYVPVLLGGVGWLVWATMAPPRGRRDDAA